MQANEITQLRIGKSLLARHFIKRKPHRHGATVAHLIARIAQQFLQQPRPVLQRTAIFIACADWSAATGNAAECQSHARHRGT